MDIKSMTLEELKTVVAEEGEKPFRLPSSMTGCTESWRRITGR